MLDPVLPVFINKLIGALNSPSGQYSSFEMKTEIVKGLIEMFCVRRTRKQIC